MGLFLDIIHLSEPQTERALSEIYKSIHDHDDRDAPHESPFIRRLIELFYQRGLAYLDNVQSELLKWTAGKYHSPGEIPVPPPGMMHRWTAAEADLVRLYLRALPPSDWTLQDHMMMVDYVFQRYLPLDALVSESEWMATRSTLMGKVQANLMKPPTLAQADVILAALPNTIADAFEQFSFTRVEQAVLEIAATRGAEYVVNLAEGARRRMREVIRRSAEAHMMNVTGIPSRALQTELADAFATLNRDWRRIAITEAGNNALLGLIASLKPGTQVRRVEQYANACPSCRKIDGRVMTVVMPEKPNKNPDTEIWVGKDNYGRSSAPRKRVGNELIPRSKDELWWVAAGLMHPNCRGRWLRVLDTETGDDPEFANWLKGLLSKNAKSPAEPA